MSLDVMLVTKETVTKNPSSGIFIRENGQTKEITEEEWRIRNPHKAIIRFNQEEYETNQVYSANITHNLGKMAAEAGLYSYLWRPETVRIKKAKELIDPLREGLHELKSDSEKYKKFNPSNGWGSYDALVEFVQKYLDACYKYPDAEIEISR